LLKRALSSTSQFQANALTAKNNASKKQEQNNNNNNNNGETVV
jgi:hypothetical protein